MNATNRHKNQAFNRKDYRILVLLAAGLFIFIPSLVPSLTQPPEVPQNLRRLTEFAASNRLSVAMQPLFFVPVNINQADRMLLQSIPGIGPTLAERIVARRTASGSFLDFSELLQVKGIGPQKLTRIKEYCSLGKGRGKLLD